MVFSLCPVLMNYIILRYGLTDRPISQCEPHSEICDITQFRECPICPRSETDNLKYRLHDVDLVEGQGTQGTQILPHPQLIGYINDSEDSTYSFLT